MKNEKQDMNDIEKRIPPRVIFIILLIIILLMKKLLNLKRFSFLNKSFFYPFDY